MSAAEQYAKGERLWRELLGCGHTALVSTFIGDFDYAATHHGLPAVCTTCEKEAGNPFTLTDLIAVEEVPPDEWNDVE